MATAAPYSLEQYLRTDFEPDAELVDGEIEERNVGEYEHCLLQWAITEWFRKHDKAWGTRSIQELRSRLLSGNVRIPDVSVWPRTAPVEPVLSTPQIIAIEVLSREDRHARMQERIEDFRRAGIANIWVFDPVGRRGWDCSDGNWIAKTRFEVAGSPIHLDLDQLLREMDEAEA